MHGHAGHVNVIREHIDISSANRQPLGIQHRETQLDIPTLAGSGLVAREIETGAFTGAASAGFELLQAASKTGRANNRIANKILRIEILR